MYVKLSITRTILSRNVWYDIWYCNCNVRIITK